MNRAFYRFLKEETANLNSISTGMELLDKAFSIPIGSSLLITGGPTVGTTAVATYLAKQLSQNNKTVIYFDDTNSLKLHRLQSDLIVFKSPDLKVTELLSLIETLVEQEVEPVLIFDRFYLSPSEKEHGWTFESLVTKIRQLCNSATIIATSYRNSYSLTWNIKVHLSLLKNIYFDTDDGEHILIGHVASVHGPKGESKIFVSHLTGHVSEAYELVMSEIAKGKTPTSSFELGPIMARGAWNFIYQVEKNKRNELQID